MQKMQVNLTPELKTAIDNYQKWLKGELKDIDVDQITHTIAGYILGAKSDMDEKNALKK